MIERTNGTFSEIFPSTELMEKLVPECLSSVKAIHFGTKRELELKKHEPSIHDKLSELSRRIDNIEKAPKSKLIDIPTSQEIKDVLSHKPQCLRTYLNNG
jgi:predicted HD phosphohydrolase